MKNKIRKHQLILRAFIYADKNTITSKDLRIKYEVALLILTLNKLIKLKIITN
jgi:hypothetical protein